MWARPGHWELWDTEGGNMVGDYDSEAEALAVVRDAVRRYGPSVAGTLALGAEHDEGGDDADLPPVIHGAELVARVADSPSSGQSSTGSWLRG